MAVPGSRKALTTLESLLTTRQAPRTLLCEDYLPAGIRAVDPTEGERKWVWSPGLDSNEVGGYADPETYRLDRDDETIWKTQAEALPPGSMSDEDRERYCRTSVDLTMRGGTTSGVVYPLAVCEIASTRRLRNIGGASAGAIAAAAAAAAELGRSYPP